MPDIASVSAHYAHGALLDDIRAGIERLGKTPDTVSVEDLGPVEEFHIGGRIATEEFLDQIDLTADDYVLDVGCGLGGASRFVAGRYGSRVAGVDLTPDYIETGNVLCSWVGLDRLIELETGDATATAYPDATFDKAYMMHVGMNIADKGALAAEIHRVLRPGGTFAIYDVMSTGSDELAFPVPWATTADESAVASPADYKRALESAGFQVVGERNRRDFALSFFSRMQANTAAVEGPPPLGLHILMGETAPIKFKNMIENIAQNRVAPVEMIAIKAA
jgi:SAM-dependent methyltransferase